MSKADFDDLRKLAEAATPGPWRETWMSQGDRGSLVVSPSEIEIVAAYASLSGFNPGAEEELRQLASDCAYIAAVNPVAVLRLLDEIERMEAEVARLNCALTVSLYAGSLAGVYGLLAENARLRAALAGARITLPAWEITGEDLDAHNARIDAALRGED